MNMLVFSLTALAALVPAAIYGSRMAGGDGGDLRHSGFWAVTLVALAGAATWVFVVFGAGWQTGFGATLWLTIAGALLLFVILAALHGPAARLLPLFGPYLVCLGVLATLWGQVPAAGLSPGAPKVWVGLHIVISVATYALVTLAAMAAMAVYLQERALKARKPTRLTALLPSVAEAEALQNRLLGLSALVLGLGLVTGMVTAFVETGAILQLNHKTFFTLLAFAVIVALLVVLRTSGMAGRRAARLLLLAYLFLTLGYPGVKLVTDVILG